MEGAREEGLTTKTMLNWRTRKEAMRKQQKELAAEVEKGRLTFPLRPQLKEICR